MEISVKICGMKYADNIKEVALLKPDFMGFIFYESSPRYATGPFPEISADIKKVGVFVDETFDQIIAKMHSLGFEYVQLHGNEDDIFCQKLTNTGFKVIKSFAIDKSFNFRLLDNYIESCDYFLFDTLGKNHGGNGFAFDWELLKAYQFDKPYFLSGGIGLENLDEVKSFLQSEHAKHCIGIDCNSRLEISAGQKSPGKINELLNALKQQL